MPASPAPTFCNVWLSGHYASILFSSQSVDVQPACASWVRVSAAAGELWLEQADPYPDSDLATVCYLRDGSASARVVDESGNDDVYGQQACEGLISGSWTEATPPHVFGAGG